MINCIRRFFGYLPEPDLAPGPWFRCYALDWGQAHLVPEFAINDVITSGIVEGSKGWLWATATPEFDQEWFEEHGFRFPSRWVTWESLQHYQGTAGDYLKLDI